MFSIPKADSIQIGKIINNQNKEKENDIKDIINEEISDDLNSFINEKFNNIENNNNNNNDIYDNFDISETIQEINKSNIKFNFNDLYTIINYNQNIVIKLSHNMDFGNLKFIIFKIKNPEEILNEKILFYDNLERLYDGILSKTDCYKLLYDDPKILEEGFYSIEFLSKNTGENWIFNRRKTFIQHFTKEKTIILYSLDKIGLTLSEPDEENHLFKYIFNDNEYHLFLNSIKYVIENGNFLHALNTIIKNNK
jgi:hypothetical protein